MWVVGGGGGRAVGGGGYAHVCMGELGYLCRSFVEPRMQSSLEIKHKIKGAF